MILVLAANEAFAPHAATAIHSAWTHNPTSRFVLLDCGLSSPTREALDRFAADLGLPLDVRTVDTSAFAAAAPDWSDSVFARLFIPEMLTEDASRAIYLDSDAVVTGSLMPLWETDLGDRAAAGVLDDAARAYEQRRGVGNLTRDYINAGVMLINVNLWRDLPMAGAALDYVRRNPVPHGDQTVINALLEDGLLVLGPEWNLMPALIDRLDTLPVPRIVHWAGAAKPWLHRDAMFAPIYLHHRDATPFPLERPKARYRSPGRTFANIAFLRRKYLRRSAAIRHYDETFVAPYLRHLRQPR